LKKLLALFFALVLIVAMLPGMAAAEAEPGEDLVITIEEGGTETTEGDEDETEPGETAGDEDETEPGETEGDEDETEPGETEGDEDETVPGDTEGEDTEEEKEADDTADPGLLPDSPFYFLKRFVENIKTWFTFDEERKTDLLAELVERREAELLALEEKYADKELNPRQERILQEAAQELEQAATGLLDRLIGEGEDLEDLELSEEALAKLEAALVNLGQAIERVADAENEDCDGEKLAKREKYQQRIQHLEQIRDKNPEAAAKGLNRAIENAQRQQARWEERKGAPGTEPDGEEAADPDADEEVEADVDEDIDAHQPGDEDDAGATKANSGKANGKDNNKGNNG